MELELTGGRLLSIWWAQLWRAWVVVTPIVILTAVFIDWAPGLERGLTLLMFLIVMVLNFVALGLALRKKYPTFRVVLVAVEPEEPRT